MNRHAVILTLLLAASGCTTTTRVGTAPRPAPTPARMPSQPEPRPEPARVPAPAPRDDAASRPPASGTLPSTRPAPVNEPVPSAPSAPAAPASAALLEQSRSQRASGSYTAAASSIERALRIDPNNAELWVELGEIKLVDDDPQQAEQMARKALTLAGADRSVTMRAERLLARAASCVGAGC